MNDPVKLDEQPVGQLLNFHSLIEAACELHYPSLDSEILGLKIRIPAIKNQHGAFLSMGGNYNQRCPYVENPWCAHIFIFFLKMNSLQVCFTTIILEEARIP